MCLFGVRKQKFNIYTQLLPKNCHFGQAFDEKIFGRKPLYNGGYLYIKLPLIVILAP